MNHTFIHVAITVYVAVTCVREFLLNYKPKYASKLYSRKSVVLKPDMIRLFGGNSFRNFL
jgi:hypothetical protein